jgi:hypothetical protein
MRDFQIKFQSGEYISEFRGFSPHWAGCFYGDTKVLGGEEKFSKCFNFFSGIGDVEWWIKAELDLLTDTEADELESLMKRNKEFDEWLQDKVRPIAEILKIAPHAIYRMGNKKLYDFYREVKWKENHLGPMPAKPEMSASEKIEILLANGWKQIGNRNRWENYEWYDLSLDDAYRQNGIGK